MQPTGLRAFGLTLLLDTPPPGAWVAAPLAEPLLHLRTAPAAEIAERWSGRDAIGWEGTIDGAPFVVERGRAGDHRFVHGAPPKPHRGSAAGTRAIHHLSANAVELRCAPADPAEQLWWRVVLDSVLFTAALLRGYEALHAGAVATPGGAVAIAATTGGGKSTLLSALLSDGLPLVSDDVLVLEPRGGDAPLAHPGPPLMTVPASIAPLPGAPIAPVGDERWVAVPAHRKAVPLGALVVLNRGVGLATAMQRVRDPLAALLGSLLRFPRAPERERARFEVAGAIAAHVPIWVLSAEPSVPPACWPTCCGRSWSNHPVRSCSTPHRPRRPTRHRVSRSTHRGRSRRADRPSCEGRTYAACSTVVRVTPTLSAIHMSPTSAAPTAPSEALVHVPGAPLLELEHLHHRWKGPKPPILNDVSLTLRAGEVTWIGGRNGVGKTTLLRLAAGILLPQRGSVHMGELTPRSKGNRYRRQIGFLSAGDRSLQARMLVRQQLDFWARLAYVPRERRGALVDVSLRRFGLEEFAERRVDRMSMGQRQRIRLAMAFLHEPRVLLLDEPRNSLDDEGYEVLGKQIERAAAGGATVLWCSPRGEDRVLTSDTGYALEDGRLERVE